jgi:hypothetical protein
MTVLDKDKVEALAKNTATSYWGAMNVVGVKSAPMTDIEGNDALQITIILPSESSAANMPSNAAIDTLVKLHDEMLKAGDQRFPFIQYTTEDDLKASADDEL